MNGACSENREISIPNFIQSLNFKRAMISKFDQLLTKFLIFFRVESVSERINELSMAIDRYVGYSTIECSCEVCSVMNN